MTFNEWFQTFIKEKGLTDVVFEFETKSKHNSFPIKSIQNYLSSCDKEIQDKVRTGFIAHIFQPFNLSSLYCFIIK
jgi:hypothetical protein